jgi:hypothetical protein
MLLCILPTIAIAGEVFVRFRMVEPEKTLYYVRVGGYIHKTPWYFPKAVWPEGADKDKLKRPVAGDYTPWMNFTKFAGKRMHGRMRRAGGVAEFPNVTADFVADPPSEKRRVVIEIATAADEKAVVKRFEESYTGSRTSFLISPDPKADAHDLETASQMTGRRLKWAREATGGKRHSPKQLIIQTSFWGPQRKELNLKEAEVLWLLGFNVVGNQREEVKEKFELRVPGHTHGIKIGPASTREQIDELMKKHAARHKTKFEPGVPFGFSDEVVCRPRIGTDKQALAHFHEWLAENKIDPRSLGAEKLTDVVPIETPEVLRERQKRSDAAARRVFYYTSRFRQQATTERVAWHTEFYHKHFGPEAITSMLVADHPYFGGTGLGMGMIPNTTWGGAPLAADWFELARKKAVDMAGIEDWLGLQFMYGPGSTWEGFQLMGFQAAIFRSGGRARVPVIAWITPSDETNLRLKSCSSLCQGAKHFFYWTYGPTATSTENYWSDLRSAYDGIAAMTRHLAGAEHIIAPGRMRKTRLALLYSISADLWQPFGYIHMLERRMTYFSLIHDQYLVDMINEDDIESGRLADYDALYVTDPNIRAASLPLIKKWVEAGGHIYGSCAAASRDEFNEPAPGLSGIFGIEQKIETSVQKGRYRFRCGLNPMKYTDQIDGDPPVGVIGTKVTFKPAGARVVGKFQDGSPAIVENRPGKGRAVYIGACPAIAYTKEARFVARELKEKWPAPLRGFINAVAKNRDIDKPVSLSHPVVEAGVYDSPKGTALVLANFQYEPIKALKVKIRVPGQCKTVRSMEKGPLKFKKREGFIEFELELGLTDIVLMEGAGR